MGDNVAIIPDFHVPKLQEKGFIAKEKEEIKTSFR